MLRVVGGGTWFRIIRLVHRRRKAQCIDASSIICCLIVDNTVVVFLEVRTREEPVLQQAQHENTICIPGIRTGADSLLMSICP